MAELGENELLDASCRPFRDLRISVTDRCNFRCRYCMPRELFGPEHVFLETNRLLSFPEIVRIAQAGVSLGVKKIRLTGGEPLLRSNLPDLITELVKTGVPDIALTTNGVLLPRFADQLAASGLSRVTVSLDSLNDDTFRRASDSRFAVKDVLEGIRAAERAGLTPIKINSVIRRGINDGDIVDLAEYFRGTGHVLRFIEYMDVGSSNAWDRTEVVPSQDVLALIHRRFPLDPIDPQRLGEVASRYRYRDGGGEVGLISSVSSPFCGTCTRARISAEGVLYTCLFATKGIDLRAVVQTRDDEELRRVLTSIWSRREDRYSELRGMTSSSEPKIEMSYIGG